MKLLFLKAQYGGITGLLIGLYTLSEVCHTEVVVDDDWTMFSSEPSDSGVRFMNKGTRQLHKYLVIDLPDVDPQKYAAAVAWAKEQLGKKYDWWGVFGFVLPWLKEDANDWFCSEICCEFLIRCGLLEDQQVSKVSPKDLLNLWEDRNRRSYQYVEACH